MNAESILTKRGLECTEKLGQLSAKLSPTSWIPTITMGLEHGGTECWPFHHFGHCKRSILIPRTVDERYRRASEALSTASYAQVSIRLMQDHGAMVLWTIPETSACPSGILESFASLVKDATLR